MVIIRNFFAIIHESEGTHFGRSSSCSSAHRAEKENIRKPPKTRETASQRNIHDMHMDYPLVNVYITMENHHFSWVNSLFHLLTMENHYLFMGKFIYFYGHFQ